MNNAQWEMSLYLQHLHLTKHHPLSLSTHLETSTSDPLFYNNDTTAQLSSGDRRDVYMLL